MYELQADLIMCCQLHATQSHKWGLADCDLLLFSVPLQGEISVLCHYKG